MKKTKIDASVLLLALIVLLLAAGIALAIYTLRSDPVEEALSGDRVINVLYVIEKDQKPLSTFVLMYYPATKRAAAFDIPGNLGLLIKSIDRVDRIDTVYDPRRISKFENEIEGLLGININFTMIYDTAQLDKLVDFIEGIEIFIPSPLSEGGRIRFPSGLSRLDGEKALAYALYETPEEVSDMPVSRRRRFFLGLLKRQSEMNGILKKPAARRIYRSFLKTDMSQRTIIRLYDEFAGINIEQSNILSVEVNLQDVSGQMLRIPSRSDNTIKAQVDKAQRDLESSGRGFSVEVLNGTGTPGLAGRTAELLRGFGYNITVVGNAESVNYEQTVVIDRSGYEDMAKTFAAVIRCENIRREAPLQDSGEDDAYNQNSGTRPDFTLIIGRDFNGTYITGN